MAASAEQKFHSSIETCLQIASMDKVRRDEYIVDCVGSTEGTFLIEVSPSSLCYVALLYMTTYCLSQFFQVICLIRNYCSCSSVSLLFST
jgi:hypothetical protein